MNILFITEISAFPPVSGERIRSYNLINSLVQFCDRLYLIAGNQPPEDGKYEKVVFHQFPNIYKRNRWLNLLMIYWRDRRLVRVIRGILDRHEIDLVFLDYKYIGNYIGIFRRRNIRTIYGTHNIQSKLHWQDPVVKLKDRIFRIISYLSEYFHERFYFSKADAIIAVSDEDLEFYRRYFKKPALHMVPNYLNEKEYEQALNSNKKDQIIMTGTFLAFQNIAGLQWFLEHVWDHELAALASLTIVGYGSREKFDLIRERIGDVENVTALGPVDDVKKYLAESKVAIIPLLHGSGTRLKCIEAMALKTNIVGTSLGVEGIRHDGSILTADDPLDFKTGLIRVLKDEVHNEEKAYSVFLENYSSKAVTPKLKEIVHAVLSSNR